MSRTYKDKPSKFKQQAWDQDRIKIPYTRVWVNYDHELVEHPWHSYIYAKTTKTKKRKEVDTEDHWMSTPSWWTHMCMTKPQRRAGRIWERKVLFEDIEEADAPGVSRKPHVYYL